MYVVVQKIKNIFTFDMKNMGVRQEGMEVHEEACKNSQIRPVILG